VLNIDDYPATRTSIEIKSAGCLMRGQFYQAGTGGPYPTLFLVPGFPGDPDDVLGLGALLGPTGINVLMVNPRGMQGSEGEQTFARSLEDIGAVLDWLEQPDVVRRFHIDPARVTLGGHSYGGGMAMSYAARDPRVRRVISIAGNDHGEFVREFQRNPVFAARIRTWFETLREPAGPARFNIDDGIRELAEHQDVYGLRENAGRLAGRAILIFGGWEDRGPTIDQYLLPVYRALKAAGGEDVTFIVYHTDHGFGNVRRRLADDVAGWLTSR
jgi:uncharacterized protein